MRGALIVSSTCGLLSLAACGDGGEDPSTDVGSDALSVEWSPNGSASAFSNLSSSSTSLQINLTGAAAEHSVEVGSNSDSNPTTVDLTTQQGTPSIVAGGIPISGGFVISHNVKGTDETFDTFTDFVSALSKDITPTATVADLGATGQYDSASNTFTASSIAVLLND